MIDEKWPFRPKHITNDGQELGLKGAGIIPNRHLQGIQTEICHALGQPTTIIEFTLEGKPVRTDSPLLIYTMHDTCRLFRRTNLKLDQNGNVLFDERKKPIGAALCLLCDCRHASIFCGMRDDELTVENIMKYKNDSSDINKLYVGAQECLFEPEIIDGRLLLQYDCPLLGYRELLFPIIFEHCVIGVFFAGQLTLKGQEPFIKKMVTSIPTRFPDCFNAYLNLKKSNKTPKAIAKNILKKHCDWINENPEERIESPQKYRDRIYRIIKELKAFEELLEEEVKHRRIAYIRNNITLELQNFSSSRVLPAKSDKVDDILLEIWSRVQTSMNNLVNYFSLRYIIVFGVNRIVHTSENNIQVVAKTDRWKEIMLQDEIEKTYLDTGLFPSSYTVCSRDKNVEYLACLKGCNIDRLGDFQLVLLPMEPHRHSSIAVLVGYDDSHPHTALENIPGSELDAALHSFDMLVVSSLAATLARGAEDNAKKQLLYLGHEAGQLVSGLDWLRKAYFEKASAVKSLPEKKIEDICQDLRGFIGQMSFFFDMASRMGTGTSPKAYMSEFLPFGEVLFKWKDTYRHEIDKKKLQIRLAELKRDALNQTVNDPSRPSMYADRFLFEQLVYNLVNNAEKYSYRGTKIDLDCKLSDEDQSCHILSVVDWGRKMPSGREVYLPFTRGEKTEEVEGLGLGLYIAKVIVEDIHHGKIEHKCEPVSEFNIPLIKPYINRVKNKNFELIKKLEIELKRLRDAGKYDCVVAFADEKKNPKYVPSAVALENEILKPTYKVTITATFPVQERRNQ